MSKTCIPVKPFGCECKKTGNFKVTKDLVVDGDLVVEGDVALSPDSPDAPVCPACEWLENWGPKLAILIECFPQLCEDSK